MNDYKVTVKDGNEIINEEVIESCNSATEAYFEALDVANISNIKVEIENLDAPNKPTFKSWLCDKYLEDGEPVKTLGDYNFGRLAKDISGDEAFPDTHEKQDGFDYLLEQFADTDCVRCYLAAYGEYEADTYGIYWQV